MTIHTRHRITPTLLAQLVLIACCLWAFAEIADAALDPQDLGEHDLPVHGWFAGLRTGHLNTIMYVLTWLGSGWVTAPILAVAALVVPAREHRWRHALMAVAVAGGTGLGVQLLKQLTVRARPELAEAVVASNGFAFPSGHTAQAVATYGVIAWSIAIRFPRLRHLAWTVACCLIATVGVSRLYLGVHWLTDVLGGLALATAWLTIVVVVAGGRGQSPASLPAQNPRRVTPSGI